MRTKDEIEHEIRSGMHNQVTHDPYFDDIYLIHKLVDLQFKIEQLEEIVNHLRNWNRPLK